MVTSSQCYYFYNTRTQETTWTNPLQPQEAQAETQASSSTTSPPVESSSSAAVTAAAPAAQALLVDPAALNGIDPALAYLDPTLYAARPAGAPPNTFTAKFNARTGRFTSDGRDPSYLSEAERAKRMSSVFFDVEKWEADLAARNNSTAEGAEDGSTGEKRKKPTKDDMTRWKEAKKRKKLAKHQWLRN